MAGAEECALHLNLSSGEKRAGCADCVAVPSGAVFCRESRQSGGHEWFIHRPGIACQCRHCRQENCHAKLTLRV